MKDTEGITVANGSGRGTREPMKAMRIRAGLLKACECFFFFLAVSCTMWDLSSPTRDQTQVSSIGSVVLTTGPPGKSQECFNFTKSFQLGKTEVKRGERMRAQRDPSQTSSPST